jgi:hypothetical protein
MIIWFEGACWVPIALRRKESTTTILVNDVVMMRRPGARERMVIRKNICRTVETSPGCVTLPTPTLMVGSARGSPHAAPAASEKTIHSAAISPFPLVTCVHHPFSEQPFA